MSELIRREDCRIPHELIYKAMRKYDYDEDNKDIAMLCSTLLDFAEDYLEYYVPAVTTDDVLAYKCPECKVISILYDPENEQFCPNCGIRRRFL